MRLSPPIQATFSLSLLLGLLALAGRFAGVSFLEPYSFLLLLAAYLVLLAGNLFKGL